MLMLTCEGDPARRLPVGLPELALLELLPGSPATAGRTSALAAAGRKLVTLLPVQPKHALGQQRAVQL